MLFRSDLPVVPFRCAQPSPVQSGHCKLIVPITVRTVDMFSVGSAWRKPSVRTATCALNVGPSPATSQNEISPSEGSPVYCTHFGVGKNLLPHPRTSISVHLLRCIARRDDATNMNCVGTTNILRSTKSPMSRWSTVRYGLLLLLRTRVPTGNSLVKPGKEVRVVMGRRLSKCCNFSCSLTLIRSCVPGKMSCLITFASVYVIYKSQLDAQDYGNCQLGLDTSRCQSR